MNVKTEARGIQSIDTAGQILKVLKLASKPMMLKQLADETSLTSAQLHGYLTSLKRAELVNQSPETGLYQLGSMAVRLGLARIKSHEPLRLAQKILNELATKSGLMSFMAVLNHQQPTILQIENGDYPLNINLTEGMSLSKNSAVGRVFLRFGSVKQNNILSASGLLQQSEFSLNQPVPMLNSLAVPYFNQLGELICVFCMVASTKQLNDNRINQQLALICELIHENQVSNNE